MNGADRVYAAVGLMSGTSLDGVDAAWLETDGEVILGMGPALTLPYTAEFRRTLRDLLDRAPGMGENSPGIAPVIRELTLRHAEAVEAVISRAGRRPDLIGFHGQTLLHDPAHRRTWQAGDAAWLAERTGVPVVYDFRSADVAAGGQGAPLVPVFHAALCRGLPDAGGRTLAMVNIGGVSNVTWVGRDGISVLAADTGPGNALLDDWVCRHTGTPCDTDGRLALAGRVAPPLLDRLLSDPFFRQPPPKSLDRQHFHAALALLSGLSPEDGAATLTEFTAASVMALPVPESPDLRIICGGGRRNPALMAALIRRAGGSEVVASDALGLDGDAVEAQCFAFLAVRSVRRLPLSFPGTTGVPAPQCGGCLVRPGGSVAGE
ncbi:anhydro-N-acetylmuramic acid kinase [Acetobacter sp. AN02]|uniref:anhydro-N-acetylmuramic acid kinase n=1 Tax=Acetobacter sp. AN02 TaxID=2894186 RepID=UPI0024343D74|nr:anhydro-N-acetylmuramic acid kinase [Acetobacter sp. AN02]MDG6094283.1 anhydro-N-acetylmuramic acid kinase [Acetobacter sp. AN02]